MRSIRIAAVLAAACLLVLPASSPAGGVEAAMVIEKTCEPGEPLVLTGRWRRYLDARTEPGEVIGCPRIGSRTFQLAAGPERSAPEDLSALSIHLTVRTGDGSGLYNLGLDRPISPLMGVRLRGSRRLALVGVATVDIPAATVYRISHARAARLGADRAFRFFSLALPRRTFCDVVDASTDRRYFRVVDATDRRPGTRAVSRYCPRPRTDWLTELLG